MSHAGAIAHGVQRWEGNPRVPLTVALAMVAAVVSSSQMALPLGVLALSLGACARLGVPWRSVVMRFLTPASMVLVLILVQALRIGSQPVLELPLGLALHREGLWLGWLMGARVLGAVSVLIVLTRLVPLEELLQLTRGLGAPEGWVEVALLTVRYLFSLREGAETVAAAQRTRLGYHGMARSLNSMTSLCGEVLLRSVDQAERTHEAMQLRGYAGLPHFPALPAFSGRDRLVTALACLLILGLWGSLEWKARHGL